MPPKPGHTADSTDLNPPSQGTKRRAPARQYIPKYRSGGWAILRALETFPPDTSATKAEIIRVANEFSDASFDTPQDSKFYTAWNSMKQLLEKGYIYKSGNPPRYCLTDEGAEVADKLVNAGNCVTQPSKKRQRSMDPEVQRTESEVRKPVVRTWIPPETLDFTPPASSLAVRQPVLSQPMSQGATAPRTVSGTQGMRVLPAGSYTIELVMDNREIHAQADRERLEHKIGEGGVDYSIRTLDIGDILWIAKCGSEEFVLDYIVERKRMDDLVGSIKDGRFHEQKVLLRNLRLIQFRLMKSGAKHIIYLIEDWAGYDVTPFLEAIQTSISSSQVVNQFFVKRCGHINDTIAYLVRMSKYLSKLHRVSPIPNFELTYVESRVDSDP
jgi:crossover junction endonuclease MUS81